MFANARAPSCLTHDAGRELSPRFLEGITQGVSPHRDCSTPPDIRFSAGVLRASVQQRTLDAVFDLAQREERGTRDIELELWRLLIVVGRLVLTYALALRCRTATIRALEARGLQKGDVRFRMDSDYWAIMQTTVGEVSFPLFAYRRPVPGWVP